MHAPHAAPPPLPVFRRCLCKCGRLTGTQLTSALEDVPDVFEDEDDEGDTEADVARRAAATARLLECKRFVQVRAW